MGSASEYNYDADGNIQKLNRDGNIIDYKYGKANQLDKVSNHLNISYQYDEIGNLIYSAENKDGKTIQDSIHWTIYGKVSQSGKENQFLTIHYQYDATGNRVQKTVQKSEFISVTHYIRDASGNILATYKETKIEEFHIYGSSRLGTLNLQYDTTNQLQNDQGKLILGYRNYELTNHLGNVLAVISDKKILLDSIFQADVISTNDYYPFGMTIQSRSFVSETYRFGFQGQESEKELFDGNGSFFKYRISDNRLGRFFAIDPLAPKYPWNSTYAFSENRLIDGIELEGLEFTKFNQAEVEASALQRMSHPDLIDQGQTSTCGIAACVYILAKKDPNGYYNTVMDLWRNGKATYNGYDIKPDDHLFDMATTDTDYPYQSNKHQANKQISYSVSNGMNLNYTADYILLSSLRDSENDLWDYSGWQESNTAKTIWGCGATSISTVHHLMDKLIGLDNIQEHNIGYSKISGSPVDNVSKVLQKMEDRHTKGHYEAMLIDGTMLWGSKYVNNDSYLPSHWVIYEGSLSTTTKGGVTTHTFNVFSWGEKMSVTLTDEQFSEFFYGSISGEK